jgi:hypothetical protein
MADYSGYTSQRQQRQDPWADAATGIAKMFMPDQETQLRMGQLRQQNQLGELRLKNADADSKAADARAIYDADRISEANVQRALNAERAKIMAEAAAKNTLTAEQARRLAELNARTGNAGSIADIYKLTPEGKSAAEAQAAAKAAALAEKEKKKLEAEANANRQKAEAEAKAAREKADNEYFAGEAKKVKEYQPPNDMDLRNAVVAQVYELTQGKALTEDDLNLIMRAARRAKLRGSAEEIAQAAVTKALGSDAATAEKNTDAMTPAEEIENLRETDPVKAREAERVRKFKKEAFDAVKGLKAGEAEAIVIEGTPEEIKAQVADKPPGTRVIWRNTLTGQYGGGMVPPPNWSFPGQLPRTVTGGVRPPTTTAITGLPVGTVAGDVYGPPQIVPADDPRRTLGYFAAWQR